jgi:hypothetical protein
VARDITDATKEAGMQALLRNLCAATAALLVVGCSGSGSGGAGSDTAGAARAPEAPFGAEASGHAVGDSVVRDSPVGDSIVILPETTIALPDTGRR